MKLIKRVGAATEKCWFLHFPCILSGEEPSAFLIMLCMIRWISSIWNKQSCRFTDARSCKNEKQHWNAIWQSASTSQSPPTSDLLYVVWIAASSNLRRQPQDIEHIEIIYIRRDKDVSYCCQGFNDFLNNAVYAYVRMCDEKEKEKHAIYVYVNIILLFYLIYCKPPGIRQPFLIYHTAFFIWNLVWLIYFHQCAVCIYLCTYWTILFTSLDIFFEGLWIMWYKLDTNTAPSKSITISLTYFW